MDNRTTDITTVATSGLVSVIAAVWTPPTFAMGLLVMIAALEIITGLLNAEYHLKPETKRVCASMFFTLAIHILYSFANRHTGLSIGFDAGSAAALFYCLHSAIKAIQNFDAAGVPIPPFVIEYLRKAEGLTGADKKAVERLERNDGDGQTTT